MQLSRRAFLRAGTVAAAGMVIGVGRRAYGAPRVAVKQSKVITEQPHLYHGWPTLARRRNGQLVLVYSGGRKGHVCPFGRVEMMTSNDQGQTWTWPRVLLDSALDDRDSGVLETAKGTLLVTSFTSLAYEPALLKAEKIAPGEPGAWPEEKLRHWQAAYQRLTPAQRQAELDVWMLRSTDGGVTWSARYPSLVNSPHGPIQLADGRLLYAGKELWQAKPRVGVCQSTDDGQSWQWLAELPTRPTDSNQQYHELHAVETADGRLLIHLRNHNQTNRLETLQSESSDGGKTWTEPHPIGVWGLPSHLLRLKDGRLLMSYGHRRPPLGNQARVSEDHGRTWSEPLMISADGVSDDLGYPSTVQLDDGSLLTVWYETLKDYGGAALRQAHWSIEA